MIEIDEIQEESTKKVKGHKKEDKSKKKLSNLVATFFKNALRSNLDLTSLADTKAGILISINGFILTVSVTASGFAIHNSIMTYAFISIILTSLGSIIFAVLAVKPRSKNKLVKKEYLEGYSSLLYYQDMADLTPEEFSKKMKKALFSSKKSTDELISHLHILASEIKKKYFWLKQAYTYFSVGLLVSASLMIYALVYVEETAFYNLSKGNTVYKKDKFYNVFEPSGAATMPDGKVLIVEDDNHAESLKLIEIEGDGNVIEVGSLNLPKKIKKFFKKDIEDLEAITSIGDLVYCVTSHTTDKNGKRKAEREKFIMFNYKDGSIENFHSYQNLYDDLRKNFPKIFQNNMLSNNVMNIEGLCVDDTNQSVLIGFRAPMTDSYALIIGIKNAKEVFLNEEKPNFTEAIKLNLNGLGIRDITYDFQKNGYWIIAGESGDRESSFELWFWDRTKGTASLVKNHPDIGFGEGITIINQASKNPALFIVEDNGLKPNKSAEFIIIDRESL